RWRSPASSARPARRRSTPAPRCSNRSVSIQTGRPDVVEDGARDEVGNLLARGEPAAHLGAGYLRHGRRGGRPRMRMAGARDHDERCELLHAVEITPGILLLEDVGTDDEAEFVGGVASPQVLQRIDGITLAWYLGFDAGDVHALAKDRGQRHAHLHAVDEGRHLLV